MGNQHGVEGNSKLENSKSCFSGTTNSIPNSDMTPLSSIILQQTHSHSQPKHKANNSGLSNTVTDHISRLAETDQRNAGDRRKSLLFVAQSNRVPRRQSIMARMNGNATLVKYVASIEICYRFWKCKMETLDIEQRKVLSVLIFTHIFRDLDRSGRAMFLKVSSSSHSGKFLDMLRWLILSAGQLKSDKIIDRLTRLGTIHQRYQISERHYEQMLSAIHSSFEEYWAGLYSIEVRYSLEALYRFAADIMLGAQPETALELLHSQSQSNILSLSTSTPIAYHCNPPAKVGLKVDNSRVSNSTIVNDLDQSPLSVTMPYCYTPSLSSPSMNPVLPSINISSSDNHFHRAYPSVSILSQSGRARNSSVISGGFKRYPKETYSVPRYLQSLEKCLSDARGLKYLELYCNEAFCSELILFHKAYHLYRTAFSYIERNRLCDFLMNQFIREGAPNEINISYRSRLELSQKLETNINQTLNADIFDSIHNEVIQMIARNVWCNFRQRMLSLHIQTQTS